MKRMLINATQAEELRVALVDGQNLYDLDIETPHYKKRKGNIYKGVVTRIEPSLEAAFVNYGSERHGFLPFKEVAEEIYPANLSPKDASIQDILKEGQEIIIQVQKEERGNKGAALTTQITLAGSYVVMMPNNPSAGGISRRIEGEDRSELRDALRQVTIPEGMGMIVRTAGIGKTPEELQWGINYLDQLWNAIKQAAKTKKAPFLIYEESDIVTLSIRDYLRPDIGEILIDDMDTFHRARDFIQLVMPQFVNKLKPYQDKIPLFSRFQVEAQIESAYQREVVLPSGGVLVIDITEALTAIDINSSRSTRGGDIEETAFHTNMEAACEIAKQLRLRDLGGLIVIDFIDMHSSRHQREVESQLRDAVKSDRARVQIGKISRFGLLEMSRQRLRPSIEESNHQVCPRCEGVGVIRSVESIGLSTLRSIEEEAMKEGTGKIVAQLPVAVATFLINEKLQQVNAIQKSYQADLTIIPNETLETPNVEIERFSDRDEASQEHGSSYAHKTDFTDKFSIETAAPIKKEEPAIKTIQPATPAPVAQKKTPGILARFFAWLASDSSDKKPSKSKSRSNQQNKHPRNNRRGGNNQNQRRRHPNQNRRRPDNQQDRDRSNRHNRPDRQEARDSRQDNRSDRQDNRQDRGQDRSRDRQNRRRNNQRNTDSNSQANAQNRSADARRNNEEVKSQDNKNTRPAADKAPKNTQEQTPPAKAPQQSPAKKDAPKEQPKQGSSEKPAAKSSQDSSKSAQTEKPRRRRSSRYNSRSSINRRRAPRDADKISVKEL